MLPGFHPGPLGRATRPIPNSKDLQNNGRKRIPASDDSGFPAAAPAWPPRPPRCWFRGATPVSSALAACMQRLAPGKPMAKTTVPSAGASEMCELRPTEIQRAGCVTHKSGSVRGLGANASGHTRHTPRDAAGTTPEAVWSSPATKAAGVSHFRPPCGRHVGLDRGGLQSGPRNCHHQAESWLIRLCVSAAAARA